MALAWQGTGLTRWLDENRAGSVKEQHLISGNDEGNATSKSWNDTEQSDAEQQSSTVLRKRHCDDLGELESDSWAQEHHHHQQQPQQPRQQSHLLKRVCSGLTFTSCEAGSAQQQQQPCWPACEEHTLCSSEPASPAGPACPSEASAPHCSHAARADTPTGSSPVPAHPADAAEPAGDSHQAQKGDDWQLPQGKASTRTSSSRAAAAAKGSSAALPPDSAADAAAASSRSTRQQRLTRKPSCDSASVSATKPAGGCQRSKAGSGSSSGSSACKGPRVRLGGRLLSPEEAEKHLREVAAAAQAAAAKAKAAAAAAAAVAEERDATAAAAAPAVVKQEPAMLARPPSPSLDAIAAAPAGAAALADNAGASTNCSPMLLDVQATPAAADQQQQQQERSSCYLAPMPVDSTDLALQQQQQQAAAAAMDALGAVGVDDDDDLDLSMLPDQLPEDFVPTPHQSSGWPSLEPGLAGLDMHAAAAADAALIGSACSAAGCNADSLAAAVQEEDALQLQQQRLSFRSSPFMLSSGACNAATQGSLACPSSPLAAAAAFRSMHSRDSSSASLCDTALLQRGSYNSSMSSSLAKSCSMPIRLAGARPDSSTRLSGPPSGLSCFSSGPDATSLAQSALPGSSSLPINMSCSSLSTMHCSGTAAMAAYDPAAAAAAAAVVAQQQEEDRVDAELQQLLGQCWSPDDTPAAMPVPVPGQAMSAPAGCSDFSQQLSCSFPQQQQVRMPQSLQGWQQGMASASMHGPAALPPAVPAGFAAQQQQRPASTQLQWKPAFGPTARNSNSSSGALSVTVPISVPTAAAAASLQGLSNSQGAGASPVQIVYPSGRQPRARKGKGSGSKGSSKQQQAKKQQQQQQQQLTMQLQVPASALPAAVPPGAHVVLHLKPSQQQQLMAVVDRLVQQRLAQTYEAGYRAGTQNNLGSSMSSGSMPPPPPVQQVQGRRAAAAAGMSMPAAALSQAPAPAGPAAAAASGGLMPVPMVMGGAGADVHGLPGGLDLPGQGSLLLPGMSRQCQQPLVDDILPSMQDLLTDCCE